MTIKSTVSACLEKFESGRRLKARVRVAMGENARGERRIHPVLSHLRYINVEASFLCNLECRMCPRLFEGHLEGLMPLERFHRLSPLFPYLDFVVLTGYGEPLLHPQLHEFVSLVHSAGAGPRLSTNGTIMNDQKANQLIDAGIENLQFSIDAGTKETFEIIRVGAKWERVLANAHRFHEILRTRKAPVDTGWVFIMMRDNYREMPQAARIAIDCGFELFVAKLIERNALDYEHEQVLHNVRGELLVDENEFSDIVEETRSILNSAGVEFQYHPFFLQYEGGCLANPLRSVYVDWMGNVSPCCHLLVRDEMSRQPQYCFGNVDDMHVMELLMGKGAQQFWGDWRRQHVPEVCQNCYQIDRLDGREHFTGIREQVA